MTTTMNRTTGRQTIGRVAEAAGVSIRALRHYDEIGLLKPAYVGENGYRYYERPQLLRLQQILIHRELGFALHEIADILDRPDFDHVAALRAQRAKLEAEIERRRALLETVTRTIARLERGEEMSAEELYAGVVSPEKQAAYEAWLEERVGEGAKPGVAATKERWSERSEADRQALMDELRAVESGLARLMQAGVDAGGPEAAALVARHHAWVEAMWGREATPEAYAGLAETYLAHPDFVARYESVAPGFARYLAEAMTRWAAARS